MTAFEFGRRDFLAGAAGALAGSLLSAPSWAADQMTESLAEIASKKGIGFGSWVRGASLATDKKFAALVDRQCDIVVAAIEMFWDYVSKDPETTDFTRGDAISAWTAEHGKRLRGHTLIWHSRCPKWFEDISDTTEARNAMTNHIRKMCTHFAGRIHSWDVVNEALQPPQGRPDGLRKSPFLEKFGPEYIDIAFQTARDADPKALLVLADYDMEYDLKYMEDRRVAMLNLIDGMKKRGTPIDALGFHSHLVTELQPKFNERKFSDFLKEISDRGLKIFVTELDVGDRGAPSDIAKRDQVVASVYRSYLDVALQNPAVDVVCLWGLSDRDSWIVRGQQKKYVREDGLPPRPLPFDKHYAAKPAFFAIADSFRAAAPRPAG